MHKIYVIEQLETLLGKAEVALAKLKDIDTNRYPTESDLAKAELEVNIIDSCATVFDMYVEYLKHS